MKPLSDNLLQLIQDPARRALRERVAVKTRILFDYGKHPMIPDDQFERWVEVETRRDLLKTYRNDPLVLRDEEGDVAYVLPYAECFLLNGGGSFGSALGLILMTETCYEPTTGEPGLLNASLARFHPLVASGGHPPLDLLHEFLEVEEDIGPWFAGHRKRHRMADARDYGLPRPYRANGSARDTAGGGGIVLSPMAAAKMAATTPTIRGRKMRACLVKPGVTSITLEENDPALLRLLFTPPARGLASLGGRQAQQI